MGASTGNQAFILFLTNCLPNSLPSSPPLSWPALAVFSFGRTVAPMLANAKSSPFCRKNQFYSLCFISNVVCVLFDIHKSELWFIIHIASPKIQENDVIIQCEVRTCPSEYLWVEAQGPTMSLQIPVWWWCTAQCHMMSMLIPMWWRCMAHGCWCAVKDTNVLKKFAYRYIHTDYGELFVYPLVEVDLFVSPLNFISIFHMPKVQYVCRLE